MKHATVCHLDRIPLSVASSKVNDMSETTQPILMVLDGHSMAFRAFYALPVENFTTSTGQHTNAVHGFVAMLINLLRNEKPTHVAVAWDLAGGTFRTTEYSEYKAGRAAIPPEFPGQIDLIKEVLDALRIVHLSKENYEADDILATLSTRATTEGFKTLLVSGDRDAMQLVNDQVTVLYPRKGVSDLARMTPEAVEEKYLVPPARYPELAALVGESADHLLGVPGVGPKTAVKWLTAYDGLENLIRQADTVKGKAGQSFRDHLDDVIRNRKLNALVRDLDLDLTLAELARHPWDPKATRAVFDTLEFRTLWDRVRALATESDADGVDEVDDTLEISGTVLEPRTLNDWLSTTAGRIGVDVTGSWGSGSGDVEAVALGGVDGNAVWFDAAELSPEDEDVFAAWLADKDRPKVMHSAKGPVEALAERGWEVAGLTCDTELASYLLHPDRRAHKFDDAVRTHLNVALGEAEENSDQAMLDFGEDHFAESMERAVAVTRLADVMEKEVEARGGAELLHDVEMGVQRCLISMERAGIAVDTDIFEGLRSEFDERVTRAQEAAWEAAGEKINLSSPKQLQGVLFDKLDMPKTRRTKSGYTTDADALAGLYETTEHPFLAHLLEHRDAIKLRQTVDGLLKEIRDDGRVHTTYMQTVAVTGRLSSKDPNLQNIPMRTEEGRRIREGFVVGEGYESLLSADYSQIEMRIMAHVSGDQSLIDAFQSGQDFHTVTASHVFGVAPEDVSVAQRSKIKAMNYGLAYGLSAYGLSNQLKVSVGEAKELMADYFSRFGKVHEYLEEVVDQARRQGYTETLLGRRRYLPDLTSTNRQRRDMAERAALNAPIQGSAADLIKLAMLATDQKLAEAALTSRVLLQVHDELILEVAKGEEEKVREIVTNAMGHAMDLSVPLTVSIGVGRSWFDAAH
ncbi:DNA polymerase I [Cutibacterium acnes HL096PA1]|nr:DNA polymerase I [Cutibacterium acnes TypeIA2 P.acn33]AFU40598.1 DNA polymerase I [Cutibacterium acnes C1]AGJ80181.1 DNA polymerase I [Cutibacterium acnes HL096PA1]AID35636.1 DNA polymerase I [Cutibacterium acnes hdn-1]EFD02133.1 DNA-directed DNA polymerase [Cutibacterium acnes SK187]KEY33999.1 DNA polymerase I [Cutibacterium acnes]MCM4184140.1 DNA polymerase I [Cutibacterium acnes P09]MCM4190103.1 DNA polymerase I [Cutibacterium acnes P07B]MCU7477128.1 DNA polymerase I [Cutibacterium ac